MLRKFLKAISRDWGSSVTGSASIPLTIFAFWADTPIQRSAWAIFAIACLVFASFRVWVFEYHRAEVAEAKLAVPLRPWVIVNRYSTSWLVDEETGEEYLLESIHIVNRSEVPAVNIIIPDIQCSGRTVSFDRQVPTLGPDESTIVTTRSLIETLRSVSAGLWKKTAQGAERKSGLIRYLPVSLPLKIEYRGPDYALWTTEQKISFIAPHIIFAVANPNDPQQWTDLSVLEEQPTAG
jgi:hypothetical protein